MITNLLLKFGYCGIFLLGISVAIYQPIAPDIFIIGLGSVCFNSFLAAVIAFLGTVTGATLEYVFGTWLEKEILAKIIRKWKDKFEKGKKYFCRYGTLAIVIASVSPIPLTQISWLAGISRMSLLKFLLALCKGLIPRYFSKALFSLN